MIAPRFGTLGPVDVSAFASTGIHAHAATNANVASIPARTKDEPRPSTSIIQPAISGPANTPARLIPPKPAIVRPRSATGTSCVMTVSYTHLTLPTILR